MLQAKYGDIVRMYSPGVFGHMVMLYKPREIKNLFSQEERIPFAPGKDITDQMEVRFHFPFVC